MRWTPLRLMQKRWKTIYIVGGYLVSAVLLNVAWPFVPVVAAAALTGAVNSAWIYYGTRIFRGSRELVEPPRAWWRMTAAPAAGFVLGTAFFFAFALSVASVVRNPTSALDWSNAVVFAAFAALYASSSVSLLRGRG